jgi:hypothetical protein
MRPAWLLRSSVTLPARLGTMGRGASRILGNPETRSPEQAPLQRDDLTLRSARRARLEGWATTGLLPPFETHRCAMLLRVRPCGCRAWESAPAPGAAGRAPVGNADMPKFISPTRLLPQEWATDSPRPRCRRVEGGSAVRKSDNPIIRKSARSWRKVQSRASVGNAEMRKCDSPAAVGCRRRGFSETRLSGAGRVEAGGHGLA